jgi:hypothetical protein
VGVTQCDCSDTLNSCDPSGEDLAYTGLGATLNTTHDLSGGACFWQSDYRDAGLTAQLHQYNSTDGSCSGGEVGGSPLTHDILVTLTKSNATQFRLKAVDRDGTELQFFDDTITVDSNTCEGILEFTNDFTGCPDYDCGGVHQLAQDGTATARRCCP